jgi:hypothetical protein
MPEQNDDIQRNPLQQGFKYDAEVADYSLRITEGNFATLETPGGLFTQQLANSGEADKLIAEFEDPDGDLGQEEDSIMNKYPNTMGMYLVND